MSKKSKLKQMAAEGNPWAIETLAKARAKGEANALSKARMMARKKTVVQEEIAHNAPWVQAMLDAQDIRRWTDGPKPARWRVYRLAQALVDGR